MPYVPHYDNICVCNVHPGVLLHCQGEEMRNHRRLMTKQNCWLHKKGHELVWHIGFNGGLLPASLLSGRGRGLTLLITRPLSHIPRVKTLLMATLSSSVMITWYGHHGSLPLLCCLHLDFLPFVWVLKLVCVHAMSEGTIDQWPHSPHMPLSYFVNKMFALV